MLKFCHSHQWIKRAYQQEFKAELFSLPGIPTTLSVEEEVEMPGTTFFSHQTFKAILRPVVRQFLSQSNSIKVFSALLESLFIEIAKEIEPKANASRLSTLTGISRSKISEIENNNHLEHALDNTLSNRVIREWKSDPRFSTERKRPRVLTYGTPESDFSKLVSTVSKDLSPKSALEELVRLQVVELTRNGARLKPPMQREEDESAERLILTITNAFQKEDRIQQLRVLSHKREKN